MKSFAVANNEKAKKPLHLMQGFLQLTTYETQSFSKLAPGALSFTAIPSELM